MTLLKDIWRPVMPGPDPTLDLDFTAEALDPRITFTRASTKTYFDSAGVLRTAAANEWPREYDPSTVTQLNRFSYSNNFSQSAWAKAFVTLTAPAGTGLWRVDTTSAAGNRTVTQVRTCRAGEPLYLSATVKAGDITTFWLRDYSVFGYATFNLTTLATSVAGYFTSASITPLGNGEFRVEAACTPTTTGNRTFGFQDAELLLGHYFVGNLQLSTASHAYIPTAADPAGNGVCVGRSVWEQRTNLLTQSGSLIGGVWAVSSATMTANSMVGPDGTLSMSLLQVTTGGGRLRSTGTAVTSGASHALTVVARRVDTDFLWLNIGDSNGPGGNACIVWFNLATGALGSTLTTGTGWSFILTRPPRHLGNGLYECRFAVAVGATTAFISAGVSTADGVSGHTGSVHIGNAQLELGLYAGPYIPTTTAAVTRPGEQASITNLASFGFSSAAGSFTVDFDAVNANTANTTYALSLGDGTSGGFANLVLMDRRGIVSSLAGNLPGAVNSYSHGAPARVGLTLEQVGANIAARGWSNYPFGPVDGTLTGKQLSGYTILGIGGRVRNNGNDALLSSMIRRLRYWPLKLTNEEMAGFAG